MSYNRLSYFNPRGDFLRARPDLVGAVGHIATNVNNNELLGRIAEANPTAKVWMILSPGLFLAETSGGRWRGWKRFSETDLLLPEPRFAEEVKRNQRIGGLFYLAKSRTGQLFWPEVSPGFCSLNLDNGPVLGMGEFAGQRPIEVVVKLIRNALAFQRIHGVHLEMCPRTAGFPQTDWDMRHLFELEPAAARVTVNGIRRDHPAWPGARTGERQWASGQKIERVLDSPQSYLPTDPSDLAWAMLDGASIGRPELGIVPACRGEVCNTVVHIGQRTHDLDRAALQVGMFMLVARNEKGEGPWLSWHDDYYSHDVPGILGDDAEELRRWTTYRALGPPRKDSKFRIVYRDFEDDGGQRYRLGVSFELNRVVNWEPMTARMKRSGQRSGGGARGE